MHSSKDIFMEERERMEEQKQFLYFLTDQWRRYTHYYFNVNQNEETRNNKTAHQQKRSAEGSKNKSETNA